MIVGIETISNWYQDIKKHIEEFPKAKGFLLGNKKDLTNERKVKAEQAIELAKKLNLEYIETSALTGERVEDAFSEIAQALISQKD